MVLNVNCFTVRQILNERGRPAKIIVVFLLSLMLLSPGCASEKEHRSSRVHAPGKNTYPVRETAQALAPDRASPDSIPPPVREFVKVEIAVDASKSPGEMPDIFRTGVFENEESRLSLQGLTYLQHKFFSEQLPGMTTIIIPLWSESFEAYRFMVERKGLLLPAVHEAEQVLSGGGRVLFDLQIMPRWLSSNPGSGIFWRYPPRDYDEWKRLIAYTVAYLRNSGAGDADYRIWEEVDTGLTKDLRFWNGTNEEFYQLYAYSVRGIKSADSDARITFGNAYAYSDILQGMINYTGRNRLPLDYLIFHPFRTPPYTGDYRDVVKYIREQLKKSGLHDKIPIHTGSWNSWIEFGKPDLPGGQPNASSPERDSEYNAAYVIQTLYAQDAAGISHHSFFARTDHSYDLYNQAGLVDKDQQFFGGWGIFTRHLIIKPVYNAFRLLSIVSGKEEQQISDRLHATFDEHDIITALASQTKDRRKIRILLAHNVDVPAERADDFRKRMDDKYKNRYTKKHYGNSLEPFNICKKKGNPITKCIPLLPQDLQPLIGCLVKGKGEECIPAMPFHLREFGQAAKMYLEHYNRYPKEVSMTIENIPFRGSALLTTYRIDKYNSNSCRYNKKTERKPTRNECGVNGDIDTMVREARAGAVNRASEVVKQFPSLQNEKNKIIDSLFYFGNYTMPDGKTVENAMWINKINSDANISVEGSKQTKNITISERGSLREMITLQPLGVVLVELSKME